MGFLASIGKATKLVFDFFQGDWECIDRRGHSHHINKGDESFCTGRGTVEMTERTILDKDIGCGMVEKSMPLLRTVFDD